MDDADGDAENNTDNCIEHNSDRCSLWFRRRQVMPFCVSCFCKSKPAAVYTEMENEFWVR